MTTPKALHTMMVNNTDKKLLEAKAKYRLYLSKLSPAIDVDLNNIVFNLVNI